MKKHTVDVQGGPVASLADRYVMTSLMVFIIAAVDSIGGLNGLWTVEGDERPLILGAEFLMLLVLLANSFALKNWVYRNTTRPIYRQVAWLSIASLLLCIGGDLVNFNLPETYYRYGSVVKHDYLADSIWFFAPGYLLLLIACVRVAQTNGMNGLPLAGMLSVAGIIGGVSINAMHLPGTGDYVSAMTGFYGIFISIVGAGGLAFVLSFKKARLNPGVLLVGGGVILATLADSVIGQFWIYGNTGEGYFPAARYVNWTLYIGSQCLVIHIARIGLLNSPTPGHGEYGQGVDGFRGRRKVIAETDRPTS